MNDPEYHKQILEKNKIRRNEIRKAIENNHVNARKDANRMAKVRRVARGAQEALDTQE